MTRIDTFLVLSLTVSVLAAACGSSDETPGGAAGAGNSAGAATGGASGGGGSAGGAGVGGASGSGGGAGVGGGSGSGGGAAVGGGSGASGNAGAGAGGSSGAAGFAGGAGKAGGGGTAAGSSPVGGSGGAGASGGAAGIGGSGGCVDDGPPITTAAAKKLSETGLYSNIAQGAFAPYAKPFAPKYPLWSDGADKIRFVYVPPCSKIDTSDMDHWALPAGTRFWKEFSINGVRVETRMTHKYGPDFEDVLFAVYQWRPDQTDADQVVLGVDNANGSGHDIPKMAECSNCHGKLAERMLGYGAIQLSHGNGGVTIKSLSDAGRLTVPAPDGFSVPGDATNSAALGYLHSNCGNCHNPSGVTDMHLRVSVKDTTVQQTQAWNTAVNKVPMNFTAPGITHLIKGGAPDSSATAYRMSKRGTVEQMPPIASKISDPVGIKIIRDWIMTLPPP